MKYFLSVDGGTTNTRVALVQNGKALDTVKLSVGVATARKDKNVYKMAIRDGIFDIFLRNGLQESDVERILASGMITSEYGLCCLPHCVAPAGLQELHDQMQEMLLPEICAIPFVFLRGVKNVASDFSETDMMRGEETELMGIMNPEYGECVYVLPGSHSKVIKTDADGRIESFSTLLTGEMFYALSQHTILADAVDMSVETVDEDYLLKGYTYCQENGSNKAIFKTRVLKNMFQCSGAEVNSFFRGVILCDEIREILRYDVDTMVIGGKKQMKTATAMLLKHVSNKKVISLSDAEVDASVLRGQLRVFCGE